MLRIKTSMGATFELFFNSLLENIVKLFFKAHLSGRSVRIGFSFFGANQLVYLRLV